ncbi:MAG TPA: O-antigen ligase family protein [Verrucomicrobiae bacterium]|nr:O-antigen ligase family protein [Verrucomicrobiae bacterium]
MTDARIALRSLAIWAVCLPLALVLGYLLANPLDMGSFTFFSVVLLLISTPILLRFHYPLMLLAWNMGMVLFFLPGSANSWLVAITASYALSFTHRIMDKKVRFLSVPQLTMPLLALGAVVFVTALLRGGFGMRAFGGEEVGGRRYMWIFIAILGYFALTTQSIPRDKSVKYMGLFFLGGLAPMLGDLYGVLPSFMNFLFYFFPPSSDWLASSYGGVNRFEGIRNASFAVFCFMLARYSIRGMLAPGRKYLFAFMCASCVAGLLSGFRSILIIFVLTFAFQFWLEGMLRTKWLGIFAAIFAVALVVALPLVTRLPLGIQRTLAFLPIQVDHRAEADAEGSSEWRLEMWRAAIPEIPKYLLLGKGYLFTREDYEYVTDRAFGQFTVEDRGAYIAGDYHSGPLSVVMPLGIWGVLTFLWFLWAGGRALWKNFRYGIPALRKINTFLLASFCAKIVVFFIVFGSIYSDMLHFCGLLGLGVALNGGVACRSAQEAVMPSEPVMRKQQAAYARRLGVG